MRSTQRKILDSTIQTISSEFSKLTKKKKSKAKQSKKKWVNALGECLKIGDAEVG